MKKFTFRLEALLTVKKNKEEEVKRRLAEKNREAEMSRQEISRIQEELRQFQSGEKSKRGGGAADIASMRGSVAYRNQLKMSILKEGQRLDEIMVAAYKINQELIIAAQERRAVEIIKEKRYDEWKKENAAAEQKFMDDLSQQAFSRKQRSEK
jgi:flagellar FliJ protein